ncbi:MAG: hypothetical protein ABIT83_25465 [Massilia sp.]
MTAAYQHVSLAEVRPGMVLSDVLLDRQGQVLLPGGAVLTAKIIALLPGHGIDTLAVLRTDEASLPPPVDLEAVKARLDRLFRSPAEAPPDARELLRDVVEIYRGVREAQA